MTSYDPQARTVEVSFTDNGSGISEEDQAKIFEPFFTTKEVGKATGLGYRSVTGSLKAIRVKLAWKVN